MMFQVRLRGRGGHGAVTAAALLAPAASGEDRHAQAFPGFGPERTGAPVLSSCRIGDEPIRTREPVTGTVAEGNAAARTAFDFVRDEREALTQEARTDA
jgi:Pyruvate/2-oxoacid:ferredoxin oxidoreductase gamma subunit